MKKVLSGTKEMFARMISFCSGTDYYILINSDQRSYYKSLVVFFSLFLVGLINFLNGLHVGKDLYGWIAGVLFGFILAGAVLTMEISLFLQDFRNKQNKKLLIIRVVWLIISSVGISLISLVNLFDEKIKMELAKESGRERSAIATSAGLDDLDKEHKARTHRFQMKIDQLKDEKSDLGALLKAEEEGKKTSLIINGERVTTSGVRGHGPISDYVETNQLHRDQQIKRLEEQIRDAESAYQGNRSSLSQKVTRESQYLEDYNPSFTDKFMVTVTMLISGKHPDMILFAIGFVAFMILLEMLPTIIRFSKESNAEMATIYQEDVLGKYHYSRYQNELEAIDYIDDDNYNGASVLYQRSDFLFHRMNMKSKEFQEGLDTSSAPTPPQDHDHQEGEY